jgi:preprotein translocase subunit SecY
MVIARLRASCSGHRHDDTGTMFLMWLGEQITERGIGNGISMIILAGIVAGLPGRSAAPSSRSHRRDVDPGAALIAIVLGVTGLRACSSSAASAASRSTTPSASSGRGAYMPGSTHLPFKLNMSGVIPPIFASSLLLFPATIASWFGTGARPLQRGCRSGGQRSAPASRCTWCCTPA